MEQWAPLNLVKKEVNKCKPVAVVAPSSVVTRPDEDREKTSDLAKTSSNSINYQIDRLLGRQETSEEGEEKKQDWPTLTEQQLLAAVYMRDFVNTYQTLFPNALPNSQLGGYQSAVYESYKRLLLGNTVEKKSDDPYPTLRERLNSAPEKSDYETSDEPVRDCSPEPLNLQRVQLSDDLPLDFSQKRSFILSPSQSLSLTSPELESVTKPLVLSIPNPQERTIKPRRRERPAKSRRANSHDKNSSGTHHSSQDSKNSDGGGQNDKKKPHIKKPLNAFMLYMKEMRAKVVAECTLKESAAINQILGRRWHSLTREEQAKYYEKARTERQLHMQLYPGWSARDNYGYGTKKKKKRKDRPPDITSSLGGNNMKKCRARYGLDQQSQWCKPCRRKKKCIRYMESGEERDGNQSDDNMEDCGSVDTANTPPDDDDGDGESGPHSGHSGHSGHSLSSPGGLSGLSSLTSPSMILPSPSTSLASPSVSLASPCMSLQSPLTPPTFDMKPILPIALPPLHRNPVGTNPHDVNNPLSVNQLTGKCIKEPKERSRAISVT